MFKINNFLLRIRIRTSTVCRIRTKVVLIRTLDPATLPLLAPCGVPTFKPKILEMGGSQLSVLSYCKILHATISVLSLMIIWVVTWGFLFRFQRVESEPTLVVLKQALVILYVNCGPVIKGTK